MNDQLKLGYLGIQFAISRHLSALEGNTRLQTKWVDIGLEITKLFDRVELGCASADSLQMLINRTQTDLSREQVWS